MLHECLVFAVALFVVLVGAIVCEALLDIGTQLRRIAWRLEATPLYVEAEEETETHGQEETEATATREYFALSPGWTGEP